MLGAYIDATNDASILARALPLAEVSRSLINSITQTLTCLGNSERTGLVDRKP